MLSEPMEQTVPDCLSFVIRTNPSVVASLALLSDARAYSIEKKQGVVDWRQCVVAGDGV